MGGENILTATSLYFFPLQCLCTVNKEKNPGGEKKKEEKILVLVVSNSLSLKYKILIQMLTFVVEYSVCRWCRTNVNMTYERF